MAISRFTKTFFFLLVAIGTTNQIYGAAADEHDAIDNAELTAFCAALSENVHLVSTEPLTQTIAAFIEDKFQTEGPSSLQTFLDTHADELMKFLGIDKIYQDQFKKTITQTFAQHAAHHEKTRLSLRTKLILFACVVAIVVIVIWHLMLPTESVSIPLPVQIISRTPATVPATTPTTPHTPQETLIAALKKLPQIKDRPDMRGARDVHHPFGLRQDPGGNYYGFDGQRVNYFGEPLDWRGNRI